MTGLGSSDPLIVIDRDAGSTTAGPSLPLPDGDNRYPIAVGEGSMWIATAGSPLLMQVDPLSRAVRATVGLLEPANEIAVGNGAVWVAERSAVAAD